MLEKDFVYSQIVTSKGAMVLSCNDRFRFDVRKKSFTEQAPQGLVTAPRLMLFKKCLDNIVRHML